jgi:hypothetical protein
MPKIGSSGTTVRFSADPFTSVSAQALMRLNHKPVAGEGIRFLLDYQNTGRQAAQDIDYYMDSYTADAAKPAEIAGRAKQNISRCKTLNPTDDRMTLFPGGGTFEPYLVSQQFATAVASASDTIFVDGCFVYRTLGQVHRTAFCFKYAPEIAREDAKGRPVIDLCTHGHYAD